MADDKQEPGLVERLWELAKSCGWEHGTETGKTAFEAASTITAKEAEIAALRAERDEARASRDRHLRAAASHFAKSCELADRALTAEALAPHEFQPDAPGIVGSDLCTVCGKEYGDHTSQSEATRLRDGIKALIDGDFAEQSVERVRDRLKAILEEAGTAGEATDLRERVRVLNSLVCDASAIIARLERDYAIEHEMYDGRPVADWCARKLLEEADG